MQQACAFSERRACGLVMLAFFTYRCASRRSDALWNVGVTDGI
jgi:hypothetical protein